ncbi:MAG: hypothetical protein ACYSUZ_02265 [Planctomycetota bacterium]
MADQNGVILLLIELPIDLIGDIDGPQVFAALKAQRGIRFNKANRLCLDKGTIIGNLANGINFRFKLFKGTADPPDNRSGAVIRAVRTMVCGELPRINNHPGE